MKPFSPNGDTYLHKVFESCDKIVNSFLSALLMASAACIGLNILSGETKKCKVSILIYFESLVIVSDNLFFLRYLDFVHRIFSTLNILSYSLLSIKKCEVKAIL